MSFAAFGSVELESSIKALFVTRRSLWARYAAGRADRFALEPFLEALKSVPEPFPAAEHDRHEGGWNP
jgi:hypothetical protein